VTGFLRACDEEFALINRGRARLHAQRRLQGAELGELQQIWQRKMAFSQRLALLGTPPALRVECQAPSTGAWVDPYMAMFFRFHCWPLSSQGAR
jgi:hypothetical protein